MLLNIIHMDKLGIRLTIRNVNPVIASLTSCPMFGIRLTIRNVNDDKLVLSNESVLGIRLTIRNVNVDKLEELVIDYLVLD